jgi:hypothetical protein
MLFTALLFSLGLLNDTPSSSERAVVVLNDTTKVNSKVEKVKSKEWTAEETETDLDSIANSYVNTKEAAIKLRLSLNENLIQGTITFDEIRSSFTNQLVDNIIPHWYGTPWSFGGHTTIPNQGKIACGYFISTTLRDMGIKLNRFTLAQKSPIDEAKMISCGEEINTIVQETHEKAFEEIDNLTKEGLYFIGFDEGHVGYLLKRDGELFLIHSNYLIPISVCIEPLKEARVFKRYSKFHLVAISHNDTLLQRWLDNSTVM